MSELPKKKVCFHCFQKAMKHQKRETGLRVLTLFHDQLQFDSELCEVHGWVAADIAAEVLLWLSRHQSRRVQEGGSVR